MNKSCARCSKIVYPIEELKCLDKTWHKTCFKCHECGMTLNMKTYKGFNKLPYCEAHIPKAKATVIADTPELKRIAENTKIQSNVQYHADFEKQKGKLTQVADDPETLRIKQNTKHISNVVYHGDLKKKAAMDKQREVSEVLDNRDTESEYFSETLAAESLSQYQTLPPPPPALLQNQLQQQQQQQQQQQHHHQQQQYHHQPQQQALTTQNSQMYSASQSNQAHKQDYSQAKHNNHHSTNYQSQQNYPQSDNYNNIRSSVLQNSVNPSGGGTMGQNNQSKYYDQYENYARPAAHNMPVYNNNNNSAYSSQQHQLPQQQHQQQQQHPKQLLQQQQSGGGYGSGSYQSQPTAYGNPTAGTGYNNQYNTINYGNDMNNGSSGSGGGGGGSGSGGNIGKISDYDPLTDGPRNIPNTTRPSSTLIYSSDRGGMISNNQPRKIGSVSDIDPLNGIYGSIDQNNTQNMYHHPQSHHQSNNQPRQPHLGISAAQHSSVQQQQQHQQQAYANQQHPAKAAIAPSSKMRVFRALYDYEAQDTDEVSFAEGDVIFEVDSIDSGWMTGRVERTGKTGMLPANYVELALI